MPRAPAGELVLAQLIQFLARHPDLTRGRPIDARHEVEERGLARSRRAHECDEAPALDAQRAGLERVDLIDAATIEAADAVEQDEGGLGRSRFDAHQSILAATPRPGDTARRGGRVPEASARDRRAALLRRGLSVRDLSRSVARLLPDARRIAGERRLALRPEFGLVAQVSVVASRGRMGQRAALGCGSAVRHGGGAGRARQ